MLHIFGPHREVLEFVGQVDVLVAVNGTHSLCQTSMPAVVTDPLVWPANHLLTIDSQSVRPTANTPSTSIKPSMKQGGCH